MVNLLQVLVKLLSTNIFSKTNNKKLLSLYNL